MLKYKAVVYLGVSGLHRPPPPSLRGNDTSRPFGQANLELKRVFMRHRTASNEVRGSENLPRLNLSGLLYIRTHSVVDSNMTKESSSCGTRSFRICRPDDIGIAVLRQTESLFRIRNPSPSALIDVTSTGQATADTVPALFLWIVRGFSNNREWQGTVEDQGKEKKIRFGMRIIICLVSASGRPVISRKVFIRRTHIPLMLVRLLSL